MDVCFTDHIQKCCQKYSLICLHTHMKVTSPSQSPL